MLFERGFALHLILMWHIMREFERKHTVKRGTTLGI